MLRARAEGGAKCFDPRPREGGDEAPKRTGEASVRVSIHAPAKGATTVAQAYPWA